MLEKSGGWANDETGERRDCGGDEGDCGGE